MIEAGATTTNPQALNAKPVTMESFTSASKVMKEKSWTGKKFSLNPAHVTEGGGYNIAAAASGFLKYAGLSLMPAVSAQSDTKSEVTTGYVGNVNTPAHLRGIITQQSDSEKSFKLGIPADYVQNPNAIPLGPTDVSAGMSLDKDKRPTKYTTNTELQLPTGEGSTIGGLQNLLQAAEDWGWIGKDDEGKYEAKEIKKNQAIIPFSMFNNQSSYDAVAKQYMLENPKAFVTGMPQVGVKVDKAYLAEMATVAADLKKLNDQGVAYINPDTGTKNEKIARLESKLKFMTQVTGKLYNVPGTMGWVGPQHGYAVETGQLPPGGDERGKPLGAAFGGIGTTVDTSGFNTGQSFVKTKVLNEKTGEYVMAPIGFTMKELGLAPEVKQVYDPKTGRMLPLPQSKEDIAKGQEIVGGPDAVKTFNPYDPNKDQQYNPSPTGFENFASATPLTTKKAATPVYTHKDKEGNIITENYNEIHLGIPGVHTGIDHLPVYKHVLTDGSVKESTNQFVDKETGLDLGVTKDGNYLSKYFASVTTGPVKLDGGGSFGVSDVKFGGDNTMTGYDPTTVSKGESVMVDRAPSTAEIGDLAGKAGPPGHAMVKPVATLVSPLHTNPKTGVQNKQLTASENQKLAWTQEHGIDTFNADGSLFSTMKQPHTGSAEEWKQLTGQDLSGGLISTDDQQSRVWDTIGTGLFYNPVGGAGHPDAGKSKPLPWWSSSEIIEMIDTNEDGTPDMLQIVPYDRDPNRPQTVPGGGWGEGDIGIPQPYTAPSPYEVPYYVDIEKATEMLEQGMTIEEILARPPLDDGYLYWTDPTDNKEYVMTTEDHQEYLQAVAHQKKVEKRAKYEDIFMDVTRSSHRPNTQIQRRRSGPGGLGRQMSSTAPSEADIGGLVT